VVTKPRIMSVSANHTVWVIAVTCRFTLCVLFAYAYCRDAMLIITITSDKYV